MPTWQLGEDFTRHARARRLAESQVAAKFPGLMKGSPGWDRAVANRYTRNLYRGV